MVYCHDEEEEDVVGRDCFGSELSALLRLPTVTGRATWV